MIDNLTGAQKAALLLMSMGEAFTTDVFKHLDEKEIMTIGEHMADINKVDSGAVSVIMKEFARNYQESGGVGVSGKDFLAKTVSKAFDSRKADNLLDDLLAKRGPVSFEKLSALSPQILAGVLLNEHPQTIALILVNLKNQTAAEIIQEFPEDIQSEVVVRIADLNDVPTEIVSEIHDVMEEQVSNISKESDRNLGGIEAAAEILNQLDNKTENAILEKIETDREELAEEIRQSMFIFADLIHIDDRGIRALLKEVSNDELILALKTATDDLTEKIFGNVSQRAAQMMKEDMEVMGPVRLKDVEQAQLSILRTARRLGDEGKIMLGGKGGEDILV